MNRTIAVLAALAAPALLAAQQPIARLLFDISREQGLPVSRVTVWETPSSWATYSG